MDSAECEDLDEHHDDGVAPAELVVFVHVKIRCGTWDGAETLECGMGGAGDGGWGWHVVRDEGVYEVEDEGGIEDDGGEEVGGRYGRHLYQSGFLGLG